MKNTRKLSNFKHGTKVLWGLRDGRQVEGEVKWVTSDGKIGVQWEDEPCGEVYDYHYLNEYLSILKKDKEQYSPQVSTQVVTGTSQDSIEDKLKELIIHLVAVNQTELACDSIVVLQKYTHNMQALEFIKRNT